MKLVSFLKESKFTFKTEKPTGRYRSFSSATHSIKLNKKEVGTIDDESPYKIRLAVKKEATKADPAPFRWAVLALKFESLEEAKTFLNQHYSQITAKFDLHQFD